MYKNWRLSVPTTSPASASERIGQATLEQMKSVVVTDPSTRQKHERVIATTEASKVKRAERKAVILAKQTGMCPI